MSSRFSRTRLLGSVIIAATLSGTTLIEYSLGKSDFFCLNNIVVHGRVFVKHKIQKVSSIYNDRVGLVGNA